MPESAGTGKRRALHDVICNMKRNSIAYQSAHEWIVTDMAALQKLMADVVRAWSGEAGELRISLFRRPGYQRKTLESSACLISQGRDRIYSKLEGWTVNGVR